MPLTEEQQHEDIGRDFDRIWEQRSKLTAKRNSVRSEREDLKAYYQEELRKMDDVLERKDP